DRIRPGSGARGHIMKSSSSIDRFYPLLILLPVAFLAIFYFTPVFNVLLLSVNDPAPGLDNYRMLLSNTTLHNVFFNTLKISILTTVLTIACGCMVAYGLVSMPERERNIVLLIIFASFSLCLHLLEYDWIVIMWTMSLVNQALLGLSVIDQLLRMVRSEYGVIIAILLYMVPYAVLPLYAN